MGTAIADAEALGFSLEPSEARDLSRVGERIREAGSEQRRHPENRRSRASASSIAEPWRGCVENAVVVAPGRPDRSATGTGLSARMATLHGRGLMRAGDAMTHASVLGSTFEAGSSRRQRSEAGPRSSRPSAARWITGITQVIVDPTDPFPEGYLLTDTWPGSDVQ